MNNSTVATIWEVENTFELGKAVAFGYQLMLYGFTFPVYVAMMVRLLQTNYIQID